MKALKKAMSKPITWGGYFKLCGICGVISAIYCVYLYTKLGLIDLGELVGFVKDKLPTKKEED